MGGNTSESSKVAASYCTKRGEQSKRRRVKAYFINPGVIAISFEFSYMGGKGIKLFAGCLCDLTMSAAENDIDYSEAGAFLGDWEWENGIMHICCRCKSELKVNVGL